MAGAATFASDMATTYAPSPLCRQPSTAGSPSKTLPASGKHVERPDRERPREQALAELVGRPDHAQGRIQDRDAVA